MGRTGRIASALTVTGMTMGTWLVGAPAALAAPAAGSGNGAGAQHRGATEVLYVSPSGRDTATCGAKRMPCRTINHAVTIAVPGATIRVGHGTYMEDVLVTKRLSLVGDKAVVDAAGLDNGIVLAGPSTAGSRVEGFTVENAIGEGILAMQTARVYIGYNAVVSNDKGYGTTKTIECTAQGSIPGDCGEGLHLMTVSHSQVVHNIVEHNVGGILVTDELGPAHANLIAYNVSKDNKYDCGITMPSHNPHAVSSTGIPQPTLGGVYGNVVYRNLIEDNGLITGTGAGVLIAAPFPGAGSYDNAVIGNVIVGNTNSGVTIHSHAPGQDVSGNVIVGNTIYRNNTAGDPVSGDMQTTGVLIYSAVVPVTGTVVVANHFVGDHYGIWVSRNVSLASVRFNRFSDVAVPLFVQP